MKDSGIAWIGEIPEEWKIVQLKRLTFLYSGKEIRNEIDKSVTSIPVYGSDGIFKYTDEYMYDGEAIMFGRKGTLGKPLYTKGKFWAVDTMYFLTVDKKVYSKYIYYQLIIFDWSSYITHTALPSIVGTEIISCRFAFPPLDEQRRIAAFLDEKCAHIDAVIEKTRASIDEYKKLKQAVITRAVTKGIRQGRKMKDSGIEWIGEIPEEWEMIRGKGLFKEVNERSNDGTEELLTVSQYTGITPRSQKNVNMFEAETLEGYKICEVGDIPANTMWLWAGAIGVSKYRGVISPSYNIYRQIDTKYDSFYLDNLLRAIPLVQHYESLSTGIRASRLRLYPQQFLNIRFPVPPLPEQQEIASYLDAKTAAIDRLIAKKEQLAAEMESCKKSLIYEYVTGKKEAPRAIDITATGVLQ